MIPIKTTRRTRDAAFAVGSTLGCWWAERYDVATRERSVIVTVNEIDQPSTNPMKRYHAARGIALSRFHAAVAAQLLKEVRHG